MIETDLHENVEYEALSYVWGDPNVTRPISCGSTQLNVTVNLFAALLAVRSCSYPRLLWVDAICIDQKNIKERDQQVRIMGDIYSQAKQVLIWLGEMS